VEGVRGSGDGCAAADIVGPAAGVVAVPDVIGISRCRTKGAVS